MDLGSAGDVLDISRELGGVSHAVNWGYSNKEKADLLRFSAVELRGESKQN